VAGGNANDAPLSLQDVSSDGGALSDVVGADDVGMDLVDVGGDEAIGELVAEGGVSVLAAAAKAGTVLDDNIDDDNTNLFGDVNNAATTTDPTSAAQQGLSRWEMHGAAAQESSKSLTAPGAFTSGGNAV